MHNIRANMHMTASTPPYITPLPSDRLWIKHLCDHAKEAVGQKKQVIIIAIARKMARLLEYYQKIDRRLRELIEDNEGSIAVITEHAIPIVLSGKKKEDTEVIIVDDLMVYGDTVETVAENVYHLTGIRPKVIAIGAYREANFAALWSDIVFPNPKSDLEEERKCVIGKEQIPAFTARNSWNIVSLKKPIDLEHTIFEVNLPEGRSRIVTQKMEEWVQQIFPDYPTYTIRHKIPGSDTEAVNVTVCISPRSTKAKNNDFNKFRFFIGDSRLSIVSYSPNIWDQRDLVNETDLFVYSELNEAWRIYHKKTEETLQTRQQKELEIFEGLLERQFKLRRDLSRVVWANYLKSFENALIFRDELDRLVTQILNPETSAKPEVSAWEQEEFKINEKNLIWILGKELTETICPLLRSSLRHKAPDTKVIISSIAEWDTSALIPEEDIDDYKSQKGLYVLSCPSTDTALSMIFYHLWKKYGQISNQQREERVRIGETFQSLGKFFKAAYKSDDVDKHINRWIDERIDLGIVVPKYEYKDITLGRRIWRRYFRPGEKEDVLIDAAQLCSLITDGLRGTSYFSKTVFNKDIFTELQDECDRSGNQVSLLYFCEGLFQGDSCPREPESERVNREKLAVIIWVFMILLDAYSLQTITSWENASLVFDTETKKPLFSGSPIYRLSDHSLA